MLPLWKPLVVKANTHKPVICDVFGEKLKKPYRPFVIFYDDKEDCYYYLRARGTTGIDASDKEYFIKPNKYEVFVHQSENPEEELFQINSLVDCSQIFKCNKDLLESLINLNSDTYLSTSILEQNIINKIKLNILEAINEVPPYLSIVEVSYNKLENCMEYKSLYLNKQIFDLENETNQNKSKFNYDFYASVDNKDDYSNQRYWNGINFCKLFLNEYYPSLVDEFEKIQHLNDDNKENESNSFSQSR